MVQIANSFLIRGGGARFNTVHMYDVIGSCNKTEARFAEAAPNFKKKKSRSLTKMTTVHAIICTPGLPDFPGPNIPKREKCTK
jgi:hypothetical protein